MSSALLQEKTSDGRHFIEDNFLPCNSIFFASPGTADAYGPDIRAEEAGEGGMITGQPSALSGQLQQRINPRYQPDAKRTRIYLRIELFHCQSLFASFPRRRESIFFKPSSGPPPSRG